MGERRGWVRGIRSVAAVSTAAALLAGCFAADLAYLSSDELGGRENGTAGSLLAQQYLVDRLAGVAQGVNPGEVGVAAHAQHFDGGTNILGIVPGTDLAHEYVVIGAHYDGLGSGAGCHGKTAEDAICNGATDNAAGATIVLNLARQLGDGTIRPRRSVVIAFWDREEDGLLGAQAYRADPVVPLEDTVAYVNLDIQGANLRPALASSTFAIGAETGGPVLTEALAAATATSPLETHRLSLVFGLGRSDHAVFAHAGVPTVFFTDATGPCYHTVEDDIDAVDQTKLRAQFNTTRRLVVRLTTQAATPTFAPGLPLATFDDALAVGELMDDVLADLDLYDAEDQATLLENAAIVEGVIAGGPEAFDQDAMVSMLLAAQAGVALLAEGPCDAFLPEG